MHLFLCISESASYLVKNTSHFAMRHHLSTLLGIVICFHEFSMTFHDWVLISWLSKDVWGPWFVAFQMIKDLLSDKCLHDRANNWCKSHGFVVWGNNFLTSLKYRNDVANFPWAINQVNIFLSGNCNISAIPFNILEWIWSGLADLLIFRLLNFFPILTSSNSISRRRLLQDFF